MDNNKTTHEELRNQVIEAIRTVYDPEIPINIYELGLIYAIDIDASNIVSIKMTLTTPFCPEAQTLPANVESVIRSLNWVVDVKLELVWDPPWTKENMSEEARMVLGIF
ncbi:MAG: Fe-S protein maturation auxiliary factor SufT [Legionellaceae bacterium]